MSNNLLSICCLGYNHADFLKENFDSIERIDYPDIEVIVVDDGSKDNSVDILNGLVDKYPFPITIIAQENTGNIGKNFNTALKRCKGELVAFISLDDVFNPEVVCKEIEMMNNQEDLAFVATKKAASINNKGKVITGYLPESPIEDIEHPTVAELLEFEYSHFGAFFIQGCIFRKSLIDAIGGFDEDIIGDDIVLRTKLFRYLLDHPKWKHEFLPSNNVFYRLHDNNIHKNSIRQIRNVSEYLERYWPSRDVPDALVSWAVYAIRNNDFNESIRIFSMNKVAASLLQNKEVQKILQASAYASYKEDNKKLITKERIKDIRIITLFGNIVFSYKKKLKQRNPTHS